jgi:hypothetical protein
MESPIRPWVIRLITTSSSISARARRRGGDSEHGDDSRDGRADRLAAGRLLHRDCEVLGWPYLMRTSAAISNARRRNSSQPVMTCMFKYIYRINRLKLIDRKNDERFEKRHTPRPHVTHEQYCAARPLATLPISAEMVKHPVAANVTVTLRLWPHT